MSEQYDIELSEFLREYVSVHKQALIEEVLSRRTRLLTVALEDIYHTHNASAVIRTCDCFGIQDLHIIEGKNEYRVNPLVVRGSSKWVDLHKYAEAKDNSQACVDHLRSEGYKLVGTSPKPGSISLLDYVPLQKTALFFGTEETGLSKKTLDQMDDVIHIPMRGFTESFNISVSAALCLNDLSGKIFNSDLNWQLTDGEKDGIRLNWFKKIVRGADILEQEFLRRRVDKSTD